MYHSILNDKRYFLSITTKYVGYVWFLSVSELTFQFCLKNVLGKSLGNSINALSELQKQQ